MTGEKALAAALIGVAVFVWVVVVPLSIVVAVA